MHSAAEVRPIEPDELLDWVRVAHAAFHGTHSAEVEATMRREVVGQPTARTLGAFLDGRMVGTLHTYPTELTLPGGARVSSDAITSASVLPTYRRRGVLRQLLTCDLDRARAQGELTSILIAAEYPIYGRFGYGPATVHTTIQLNVRAPLRGVAPGTVELVDASGLRALAPDLFDRFRRALAGQISRSEADWDTRLGIRPWPWNDNPPNRFAVYRDPGGAAQGYVVYRVEGHWEHRVPGATLHVQELIALSADAYVALWRYCSEVDLVARVEAGLRSVDEPLPWLLENPRADCREIQRTDFLWLRPLDLAATLAARTYACEAELVLEVNDPLGWGGRVVLHGGVDGATCTPTRRSVDLTLCGDALGVVLLGRAPWRSLAAAGRISEDAPGALERAAAMFAVSRQPWCSTFF